jgi:hypothetical protein
LLFLLLFLVPSFLDVCGGFVCQSDSVGGWMGDPTLAAFDPIFWFHHSNIERLFKTWQASRNATSRASLDAIRGTYTIPWTDPFPVRGSVSVDATYALSSFPGNLAEDDVVWQTDVQYVYGLVMGPPVLLQKKGKPMKWIRISVNRAHLHGPFVVEVSVGHKTVEIPVFQKGPRCDNCKTHATLTVSHLVDADELEEGTPKVHLRRRDGHTLHSHAHVEIQDVLH